MIKKDKHGEFVCICSTECGAELFGGIQDDFRVVVTYVKDQGWKIINDDGEWIHLCPDCRDPQ